VNKAKPLLIIPIFSIKSIERIKQTKDKVQAFSLKQTKDKVKNNFLLKIILDAPLKENSGN
jgi:hypothetical protein